MTCLGPSGNTYINRTQLPRMVDTEAYLGDIISFGELTVAFQFVPVLLSARQQSAVDNAVHYVRARANKEKQVPKEYFRVAHMVRLLTKQGSKQFPEARELMASSLVKEPINAEGWAQVTLPALCVCHSACLSKALSKRLCCCTSRLSTRGCCPVCMRASACLQIALST